MNWDQWFIKTGNTTIYWFATGRRPDIGLLYSCSYRFYQEQIFSNIAIPSAFLGKRR